MGRGVGTHREWIFMGIQIYKFNFLNWIDLIFRRGERSHAYSPLNIKLATIPKLVLLPHR